MTLHEAIKTNLKFKRKEWNKWWTAETLTGILLADAIADDYEVFKEPKEFKLCERCWANRTGMFDDHYCIYIKVREVVE